MDFLTVPTFSHTLLISSNIFPHLPMPYRLHIPHPSPYRAPRLQMLVFLTSQVANEVTDGVDHLLCDEVRRFFDSENPCKSGRRWEKPWEMTEKWRKNDCSCVEWRSHLSVVTAVGMVFLPWLFEGKIVTGNWLLFTMKFIRSFLWQFSRQPILGLLL